MIPLTPLVSGRLRAAGFDEKNRTLIVELDDGTRLAYTPFSPEMWRRFVSSSSPWSYYRDQIEEELTPQRLPKESPASSKSPLDDLFS